ncbi:FMN-binding protein [Actinacidiphila sp. DG2A-62]|uniref:FMN-binding protein n=1 Tax=Actinacidiphila sp. DG2A-62 TaxID=3108821 RepID=UPI002DBA0E11|nr:FMN-binding protein [Actinacidiphila sp. DG2A-62]MEC3998778.1 FMN-binding protein [Actinacidiphila sp. DG2A-62]
MTALPSRPLRRIVITSVSTVAGGLLLLSLKPHGSAAAANLATDPAPTAPSTSATSGTSGGAQSTPGSSGAAGSGSSGSSGTSGTSGTRTVDGDTVQTRYGPVQLRVTLSGGRITAVTTLQLPQDNPRDQEISSFAVPQLTQEVLAAQSAQVDTVSGATYTSEGYLQSLQSALDKSRG